MNIHILQHEAFEGPGSIAKWAQARHYPIRETHLYKGDPLPALRPIDLLVIMGGSMGVYEEDEYDWLQSEKAFIRESIEDGQKVLGICLGAQLVAEVLGANVTQNTQKEIGWFPIRWNQSAREHRFFNIFPEEQMVFHWHGDTFSRPENSVALAESTACAQQAFVYQDQVVGFQFHLETTREYLAEMLENGETELKEEGAYVQSAKRMLQQAAYCDINKSLMGKFLDRFTCS